MCRRRVVSPRMLEMHMCCARGPHLRPVSVDIVCEIRLFRPPVSGPMRRGHRYTVSSTTVIQNGSGRDNNEKDTPAPSGVFTDGERFSDSAPPPIKPKKLKINFYDLF